MSETGHLHWGRGGGGACVCVCVRVWLCVSYLFFVIVFRCATLRQKGLPVFGLGVISVLTAGFDSQ